MNYINILTQISTGSRRSILKTPKTSASQVSLGRSSQQSDHPETGHSAENAAFSSQQSLNDDRKTVSIKENPEVFYVDRSDTRKKSSDAASSDHVIQIEVSSKR